MRPAVLTESRFVRFWRRAAWAWLALVLVVGVHQLRFWSQPRMETDVLALLPQDAADPLLERATRRIADAGARQLVVLLGASDAAQAQVAATAYRAALQSASHASPIVETGTGADWFEAARTFYQPWRDRLLTDAQRHRLESEPVAALADAALAALYGPIGAPRLSEWRSDPLNLWPGWWQERLAGSGMSFDESGLLHAEDRFWALLQFETRASAFRLDGEAVIVPLLDRAGQAAQARVPGLRELRAGVPLHAEAAAVRASAEVNLIGFGSLAAVLLLAWLAFRSLRPILLVAMSLVIGMAVALSVTLLVFGQVHLITLVFGASLVGVAEDYGIHWFASRQGYPRAQRWPLLRGLLPGMTLAWLTSALAYLALGLAPFPGLRQMAVFSVAGLAGAFITAILWFPWLDRAAPRTTGFARLLGDSLAHWPRWRGGWLGWTIALLLMPLAVIGLMRVQVEDSLRSLQSSPPQLLEQQREIARVLPLPSPAQFFLVRAGNGDDLLQREQALTTRLAHLRSEGRLRGYQAISDWVPPRAQQLRDAAASARVEAEVLARVAEATGEELGRPTFAAQALDLDTWLQSPASAPLRSLWLGGEGHEVASVVRVDVGHDLDVLAVLQAQADELPGVRWVDRTAEYSSLLGHYRRMMGGLLLVGGVLVLGVLVLRYRREAWRVATPTLLAGVLAVATLGWLGQPLQLFHVLALLLLLGMGIDYGIFLLEQRSDPSAWLAVCVGAASTWLSFGLLALSATPALAAFGLILLLGIGLVWLISPMFRPLPLHPPLSAPRDTHPEATS